MELNFDVRKNKRRENIKSRALIMLNFRLDVLGISLVTPTRTNLPSLRNKNRVLNHKLLIFGTYSFYKATLSDNLCLLPVTTRDYPG